MRDKEQALLHYSLADGASPQPTFSVQSQVCLEVETLKPTNTRHHVMEAEVKLKANVVLYSASLWTHLWGTQEWHAFSRDLTVLPAHSTYIRYRNEPYLPWKSFHSQ